MDSGGPIDNNTVKATVIIPTRDRAELLRKCLEALARQSLSSDLFEVIVIDNGSTDTTRKVAEDYNARLNLVYFYEEEPGLHVGRHAGARLAKSDILIFGDDDIVPCVQWVSTIVAAFEDPEVVMVGGNNHPLFEVDPPEWFDLLWCRPIYKGRALGTVSIIDFGPGQFEIDPYYIWGCNFSIRRTTLTESGGFHPDALPESMLMYRGDGESAVTRWVRNKGLLAIFDSGASVSHFVSEGRMSKDYFCRRYFSQGVSASFADIRSAKGNLGFRNSIKYMARRVWWRLKSMGRVLASDRDESARQLLEIEQSAQEAYLRGYHDHRKCVKSDPELLAWVLKESYF